MKRRNSQLMIGLLVGCFSLAVSYMASAADLIDVTKQGDLSRVKKMIEQGAKVDEEGYASQTPLIWACYKGHLDIVKYLVEKGADINHKESDHGKNSLMLAAEAGHLQVVKFLLDNKADISASNKYGGTALMSAAQNGHTNIVDMLLSSGAKIDHKGSDGQTALMLACGMGHLPTVKFLISKGADFRLKDNAGRTPEDWAKIARKYDIVSYFQTISSGIAKNAGAKDIKVIEGKFGESFSFSERDDTSGKQIKCSITISTRGSSTGGFTPKGMRRYEFGARIENATDSQVELGIGPMDIIDDKGKSYGGIIYDGPVHVLAGGMEMVLGEVTGEPSGTLTLTPKEIVERVRFFVTLPEEPKPKDFIIMLGTKDPRKLRMRFTE